MAIRIRTKKGIPTCAVCAAKTMPKPGDIYLDDGAHQVLATKFGVDWTDLTSGRTPFEPEIAATMESEESEPSTNLDKWKADYGCDDNPPMPERKT